MLNNLDTSLYADANQLLDDLQPGDALSRITQSEATELGDNLCQLAEQF